MMQLRQAQRAVMDYRGGRMAISAVPGSGKTTTLSLLAAGLVADRPAGQVLIVTFSNAAASSFKHKIAGFLGERGLPRQIGYDVRTLHSLSHLLVQENAAILGLDTDYKVLDDNETNGIRIDATIRWTERCQDRWLSFLRGTAGERSDGWLRRQWRDQTGRIAAAVIRTAKLGRTPPNVLMERLNRLPESGEQLLARMGAEIYSLYQTQVQARAALDFDDLIWLACSLLEDNPGLVPALRQRWPYILEDEAQDSSPLQERILELLTGPDGNWARVGDPNQAINATFTSADPRYFRRFSRRPDVRAIGLDQSGRSARPILYLANALARWVCERYPEPDIRTRAFEYQIIRPTDAGDPQPNPPTETPCLVLNREFDTWQEELADTATRAAQYAARYPERTLAILLPTNDLGNELGKILRSRGVAFDELLRTPASARHVAQALSHTLDFLAEPADARRLGALFHALTDAGILTTPAEADPAHIERLISSCRPEALLFPPEGARRRDALPPRQETKLDEHVVIDQFAARVARWARAAVLPADELLLTIGTELFRSPFDLAVVQQLAVLARRVADDMPALRLPDLAREIHEIAFSARGLNVAGRGELGFEPQPGRITIATMHKAKGLEWDLVYLISCTRDWLPLILEDCRVNGPNILEGADTEAEVAALTRSLAGRAPVGPAGRSPTHEARLELIAERLRLLYVGITRARRNLVISWARTARVGGRYDRAAVMAPIVGILRELAEEDDAERPA